jgi:glyoxylase-like metal-dependent hydrolase (beta-lactamase superfamily II)
MTPRLPATVQVIERGWLSANNILLFDGDTATLIDSGYISHAAQTVALVRHALAGRPLSRVINTHAHADHMGGNAALQAAFGCQLIVPHGLQSAIAEWDEDALLLSPLGQQAARFAHDATVDRDQTLEMGELSWQALAVPGHDMDALAYYNAEQRLLISGDALWENGFGVVFPELLGQADGLAAVRATLDQLSRLPIDIVIPGHGAPFANVDQALRTAYRRLAGFEQHIDKLAWHAIKVIVVFALMEKGSLAESAFAAFVSALPFALDVNQRYLGLAESTLIERLLSELLHSGALQSHDGELRTR